MPEVLPSILAVVELSGTSRLREQPRWIGLLGVVHRLLTNKQGLSCVVPTGSLRQLLAEVRQMANILQQCREFVANVLGVFSNGVGHRQLGVNVGPSRLFSHLFWRSFYKHN